MNRQTVRERLLASTMIGGIAVTAMWAAPALAADNPQQVQEVVVTGSRIPRPNLTSASPIATVTDQEIKLSGTTEVAELIDSMPQVYLGGTGLNNSPNPLTPYGGFTTVDLRGLGPQRTLVLIDGKRMAPGDPVLPVPDIDTVPSLLVDRIELVSGGASAVYGSDAVAGVVNFVMKKDFEGLRVDTEYSFNQHENDSTLMKGLLAAASAGGRVGPIPNVPSNFNGGAQWTFSAVMGVSSPDGKGNLEAFASYRHADPIYQRQLDYSACQINSGGNCTGSGNSNLFFDTLSGNTYAANGGQFVSNSTPGMTPPSRFNSNAFETANRGDERYQFGMLGHYHVNNWLEVYDQFSYLNDRSEVKAAPSAIFQQNAGPGAPNGGFLVNCDNSFLTAQERNAICTSNGLGAGDFADLIIGRRNVEGGARVYNYQHNTFREVVGARGEFADAWHYDIYGQFSYTQANNSVRNDLNMLHVANALQVRTVAGVPTCLSVINHTDTACVPYNIFSGTPSAGALAYLADSGSAVGTVQQQIVSANVTGDLGKYGVRSPWAKDGVALSLGAEYRRDALTYTPDQESLSGNLTGAGGASPPNSGAYAVKELFGEVRVPLVQDAPLAKDLAFEGGYRTSNYSSAGTVNSYKAALEWSVNDDLRLRASFQRAVRAPNIVELFAPQTAGNSASPYLDNCTQSTYVPSAANLTACERTHLTAAQVGHVLDCPAGQCGGLIGGNPNLKPEESDTKSVGLVFTPSFFRGFAASVDYFDVDVKKAIAGVPPSVTLAQCEATGDPQFCNLIIRSATGTLFGNGIAAGGYIVETGQNIGFLHTKGVDVDAGYRVGLQDLGMGDHGSLNFDLHGTYTSNFIVSPGPGLGSYDCAGLYGATCSAPLPKWRHTLRMTWTTPWKLQASLRWRYFGSSALDANQSNPLLAGTHSTFDAHIPAYNYFDLSGSWQVRDGMSLRAGVNNLFDKAPPIISSTNSGIGAQNTFPSYDLFGRTFFIGLTADF